MGDENIYISSAMEVHCRLCEIRSSPLCQALGHKDSNGRANHHHILPAGQDVARRGEIFENSCIVLSGWLCCSQTSPDGRRQILNFALPGEIVNLDFHTRPLTYDIQALTQVRLCFVSHRKIASLLDHNPEQAQTLLSHALHEEGVLMTHLASLGRPSARERLATFFFEIYSRLDPKPADSDTIEIPLPLTQHIIGEALGLTGIHVNRTLKAMAREGLISYGRNRLQMLDLPRLRMLAEFDAGTTSTIAPQKVEITRPL